MFNYILVYTFVCMHLSSIGFRRRERDSNNYTSHYLHLFTLHVTKKCSFNILKTISFKIEQKTTIEAQSEVKATKGLTKSNPKKMHALSEARDFGNSNLVALTTFVRCSIFFSKSNNLSCSRHHPPEVLRI